MKIIIVGCGNVGATLAEQLSKELLEMVQVLMHRQMQGLQMQTL